MHYPYYKEIVNTNSVKNFNQKVNFIGYILPDGTLYKCENHNVSNAFTVFKFYLALFINNYDLRYDKDIRSNDPLIELIIFVLKNMSLNELKALDRFLQQNSLNISDLLVQLFDCHLVTRLNKKILTTSCNHEIFYNYLLHDFDIENIDKIVYFKEKELFSFVKTSNLNRDFIDELDEIKKNNSLENRNYFLK